MEYYRPSGFNSKCFECKLATGSSVYGQSEVPLDQVKLIVVSAYPGRNEVMQGISLASRETSQSCSAGAFLRKCIAGAFNKEDVPENLREFYQFIYATNAIKCEKRDKKVTDKHIDTCYKTWLRNEIRSLPEGVPILIAAGEAFKSLFPNEGGLFKNRRREDLVYEGRRCVATLNPIEWERNHLKIITESTVNSKTGVYTPVTSKVWAPYPVGSILWHIKKDLDLIKSFVLERENDRSKP
jgi:uracil-DNA glycosylase